MNSAEQQRKKDLVEQLLLKNNQSLINKRKIYMTSFKTKAKLAIIGFAFIWQSAIACTSFQLIAADGSRVYARTMEFAFALHSDLVVTPRKLDFVGTGPNNTKGIAWTSKYGVVGMNGFDQPVIIDGMNEKGMEIGRAHV